VARRDAGAIARKHRVANFPMMGMSFLERPVVERRLLRAARASLRAQAKKIRRRAIEIALIAVDDAMLEQPGRIPGGEFFRSQVWNPVANLVPRLLLAQ
jgi:hypothetical protein